MNSGPGMLAAARVFTGSARFDGAYVATRGLEVGGCAARPIPTRSESRIHRLPVAGPSRLRPADNDGKRFFSSTGRVGAQKDFYSVLGVPKNASQTDIKRQFYQLSKKYHPDMNRDDDSAKQKFQEVNEAYATLGNDRSRRAYDANRASGGTSASYGHYSTSGGPSSMNVERRARAAYAWDYTRRRNESPRARRGTADDPNRAGPRPGFSAYGRGGVDRESSFGVNDEHPADRLGRLAERERRRRERAGLGEYDRTGATASQAQTQNTEFGNALVRFCQGAGIFLVVLWMGTVGMRSLGLGGGGRSSGAGLGEERSRRLNRASSSTST